MILALTELNLLIHLFEVTTEGYLKQFKKNAADNGVTMVLIMVDDEGDGCSQPGGAPSV